MIHQLRALVPFQRSEIGFPASTSSLDAFSSSSIGGPVFHAIADYEHTLLYLPGTGISSHEIAISGSFQQNLAGMCNGVFVWWVIMGWIPQVRQWILAQKLRIPKIQFAKHKKIKKKEDQHMDTSFLLRIGNKIPMEGVTETKFGAEMKGRTNRDCPFWESIP